MGETMDTTFLYHAFALGFGGTVRHPENCVIPSLASAVLPVGGGVGFGEAGPYKDSNGISFHRTTSRVSGSLDREGNFSTLATATVEGLNIQDVLRVDKIVARVTSSHAPRSTGPGKPDEADIRSTGSHIEGLKVGGTAVQVEIDSTLDDLSTLGAFTNAYASDAKLREDCNARFLWGQPLAGLPDDLIRRYAWCNDHCQSQAREGRFTPPSSKGLIIGSIVKQITPLGGKVSAFGNVIVVPDFGKIFLGELFIFQGRRRLNMMRLELGSPLDGDVTVSSSESNGTPFP